MKSFALYKNPPYFVKYIFTDIVNAVNTSISSVYEEHDDRLDKADEKRLRKLRHAAEKIVSDSEADKCDGDTPDSADIFGSVNQKVEPHSILLST